MTRLPRDKESVTRLRNERREIHVQRKLPGREQGLWMARPVLIVPAPTEKVMSLSAGLQHEETG